MPTTTMGAVAAIDVATAHGALTPTPTAVALLYEQQAGRIYAYALRRVREHMDADDVVAETFRRALEHLDRYERHDVPVSAWLYRIAHNIIADRYRRVATLPLDLAAGAPDSAPGPEQAALQGEQRRAVRAALAALSPAQRQVLWLHYGCDLRYREIGRALRLSEGTVKQVAHRARCAVRKGLVAPTIATGDCGDEATRRERVYLYERILTVRNKEKDYAKDSHAGR